MFSVYRVSAREPSVPELPPWRPLLSMFGWAAALVAATTTLILLFDAVGPTLFAIHDEVRFVPAIDASEQAAMIATIAWLAFVLARRVGWVRRRRMIARAALLMVLHVGLLLAAATVIFWTRGGLKLFEPALLTTSIAPDGRVAYVYTPGGLECGYDVYVASPIAITMSRSFRLTRETCNEPVPRVAWRRGRSPALVDAQGVPIEPQASKPLFFGLFGTHGC
jgi:hypothetical protein